MLAGDELLKVHVEPSVVARYKGQSKHDTGNENSRSSPRLANLWY